ncbi:MAG: DUF262 domain-containing protein [Candidatus Omnitrophica bacterium]|nr:DUF262 domain-containing protein [Candidatus Omnitrophota bacterium]
MQELINIDTIFKKKLFRIPDYQRGYAWQLRQLIDFWEDIITLEEGKSHYTGVLTLEAVSELKWRTWDEDMWIINNKGYTPYFVVDGQQRLTTCVILIQAIIEAALQLPQNSLENKEDFELCDTKISDIRKDYIFLQRTSSILRSYIFGYEKDNPSYEFLKTKVFNEVSSTNQSQETLYTQNLENAKKFFNDNLNAFEDTERQNKLEIIFKKLTRHLLFNEYVIQSDVDVFIAFETMNNRGKKLSDLELLKNRLIYLTTLYQEDDPEKAELRRRINNAWKDIYFQLGKSKENPLKDDDFLKAHWIMFFKYSRKAGRDYIRFLLDEQFSPKKVLEQVPVTVGISDATEVGIDSASDHVIDDEDLTDVQDQELQSRLTISQISDYAESIQQASGKWADSFDPWPTNLLLEEKKWLDRLNRIEIGYFRPLVMSSYLNETITSNDRLKLFKAIERFIFIAFRLSQVRGSYRNSEFYNASRNLYYGDMNVDEIIETLNERLKITLNDDGSFKLTGFQDFILTKFKHGKQEGFYGWGGLRYFLFEYEQYLFSVSQSETQKIKWDVFAKNSEEMVSIEHILPQTPDLPCWKNVFGQYSESQLNSLTHSLGNLLALSQPKNSSLQNFCYLEKRADNNTVRGYFNGSYSENRVAENYPEWTAEIIKERGLEMFSFMESRWQISLGDESAKIKLLNLEFLQENA